MEGDEDKQMLIELRCLSFDACVSCLCAYLFLTLPQESQSVTDEEIRSGWLQDDGLSVVNCDSL